MNKIAIVGIGRVGLPLALYMESVGFKVIGVDRDKNLIKSLKKKEMPFEEPGCQNLLNKSQIDFTDDFESLTKASHIFITVGTPLLAHLETDLSNVKKVIKSLIPILKPGMCIIIRSTIAPRTTEYVKRTIEADTELIVGKDIGLAFCPERLAEHKALEELSLLPQIIGCEDNMSFQLSEKIFQTFGVKIFQTNYLSAELTKLFNNSARYVQFALANQFALYAHNFGQDIYKILQLCNEDYPRGMISKPGFTAGTCLRKDYGMVNELFSGSDMLLSAWKINEFMPFHLTELAQKYLPLTGAKIAVLGYTFKANSDDSRDSLVPKLIRYLERYVPQCIKIHEPNLKDKNLSGHPNVKLEDCLKDSNFIFIAMNHDEFKNFDKIAKIIDDDAVIVDLWNCLGKNKVSFSIKELKS